MKTTNNNRKSKFLAFLLSVMMVSSAGALFASCTDDGDSSSTSSTEEKEEETRVDNGDIKNANFDFTELDKATVISTSPTGWSSISSHSSENRSKTSSGVIDTAEDAWTYMTGAAIDVSNVTEAEAIEAWNTWNLATKRAYYDVWKAAHDNKAPTKDTFEKYESLTEEKNIPTVNPGIRELTDEEKADGKTLDTQVLMIHNNYYYNSNKPEQLIGTAQKCTSSSTVTIPAGSSGWVSVWVKTADLKMASTGSVENHEVVDAIGKGAYISITNSVGGKSLDAYQVKNIDTAGEWEKYSFYIKGSNYADTTYSLTLGLGEGNKDNRFEYVDGYAFFDDIQCDIITNEDFGKVTFNHLITGLEADKVEKTVDAYENPNARTFGMDFSTVWANEEFENFVAADYKTEGKNNPEGSDKDVVKVDAKKNFNVESNSNLKIVYDKFLDTDFVGENEDVFMILSNNGTAYTVEDAVKFTLKKGEKYMAISLFVRTSDLNGGTGAGITLVDADNKTPFTSIDTTDAAKVKIGDDEDAYDGWQQVFFFIERAEDATTEDINLSLTFNYGPTDITSSTADSNFQQGFAAFTKLTSFVGMSELDYEAAKTGTYAKKVTVYGEQKEEETGDSGFDTAASVPEDALENGNFANPQNYKGVYNDNYRVALPTANETDAQKQDKRAYNQYAYAGLLNKEHFGAFIGTDNKEIANQNWEKTFGDATQPLVIMNQAMDNGTGLTDRSYGFIGNTKTLSDEYTAVSLRVMTMGATASVYLMDMSDKSGQTVLSIGAGLTYWYDENGNICTGDPAKKSSAIAFNLDKNGLYKANKNWENYEKLGDLKNQYFANLEAYTEKDGILYANENSAYHDYEDYTWDEAGRPVFYKKDGAWFTEKDGKGVKVNNLFDITSVAEDDNKPLTARFLAEDKRELKVENIDTNGKWVTVTFYVRKGETSKSYRLEVWSGTRDGKVCTEGFVAFDSNNPGTASSNFDNLISEYKELEGVDTFESVFSYYDTDKHVRYDADRDEDKSGNAYEDNIKATLTAESSTAYLRYEEDGYAIFADYSLSDKSVAAKEVSDDDTTDDSTEDEDTDSEINVWLLASSIAVAGVLVLAVISIIVRKIVENARKKRGTRVRKAKAKKAPVAKKVEKTVDEDSPYND